MIVSASYRTDIPALYARWFESRFRAGFCMVRNPYGGPPSRVDLRSGVDGFVFWTRNARPFLPTLAEVQAAGFPFVVQYTATGYPRALEKSVPDKVLTIETMRRIADDYGPHALVWRYDPIVVTSMTPLDWHAGNFAHLAERLSGKTDEVVLSFVQPYAKTVRNMRICAEREGFSWSLPDQAEKAALLQSLAGIAASHGIRLSLCTQPELTSHAPAAACVDAGRLSRVAGRPLATIAQKGNRPGCQCSQSKDIGSYDSCTQGCAYCYAVSNPLHARQNRRHHRAEDLYLNYTQKGHK